MLLRTFQPMVRVAALMDDGSLVGSWDHVPASLRGAYRAMAETMAEAGIDTAGRPPVWAWWGELLLLDALSLLDNEHQLSAGYASVEFEAPTEVVVASDCGVWNDHLAAVLDGSGVTADLGVRVTTTPLHGVNRPRYAYRTCAPNGCVTSDRYLGPVGTRSMCPCPRELPDAWQGNYGNIFSFLRRPEPAGFSSRHWPVLANGSRRRGQPAIGHRRTQVGTVFFSQPPSAQSSGVSSHASQPQRGTCVNGQRRVIRISPEHQGRNQTRQPAARPRCRAAQAAQTWPALTRVGRPPRTCAARHRNGLSHPPRRARRWSPVPPDDGWHLPGADATRRCSSTAAAAASAYAMPPPSCAAAPTWSPWPSCSATPASTRPAGTLPTAEDRRRALDLLPVDR